MRWSSLLLFVAACDGPPASDAALCRDVAHRICISECPFQRNDVFAPATDCEATLVARPGCEDESFMFQSRSNFVSCRAPILRAGDDIETKPRCDDIDEMYLLCPSMKDFYRPR